VLLDLMFDLPTMETHVSKVVVDENTIIAGQAPPHLHRTAEGGGHGLSYAAVPRRGAA